MVSRDKQFEEDRGYMYILRNHFFNSINCKTWRTLKIMQKSGPALSFMELKNAKMSLLALSLSLQISLYCRVPLDFWILDIPYLGDYQLMKLFYRRSLNVQTNRLPTEPQLIFGERAPTSPTTSLMNLSKLLLSSIKPLVKTKICLFSLILSMHHSLFERFSVSLWQITLYCRIYHLILE